VEADNDLEAPPAVGFIGLGQIGAPMARHWIDWPGGLTVFDLRVEATAPFGEGGAFVAGSVAEVAARADVISVMVLNDDQVRSVVAELLPSLRPGAVVAVHSTIRPETAIDLAPHVAAAGGALVDAPVSGGFMGAGEGRLAIMVGGDRTAYDRLKAPFKAFAEVLVHAGPAGAGTKLKLARNLVTFVSYTAAAEAQRLAEAAGLDLGQLGRVMRHSDSLSGGPGAIIVRQTTAAMADDDPLFDIFCHTQQLGEKDLELALELGDAVGIELPMTRYALHTFAAGLGVAPWPDQETL
jgi:3-hydroxyisobutyrate dehydrogenase-like beta-hydroxyacid dehydrogenase